MPHFGVHPNIYGGAFWPPDQTFLTTHLQKYLNEFHYIFDQIPQYRYCDNIVGISIGTFTKYQHNL